MTILFGVASLLLIVWDIAAGEGASVRMAARAALGVGALLLASPRWERT